MSSCNVQDTLTFSFILYKTMENEEQSIMHIFL